MIQVEFTDMTAGRWGFNSTVKFSLPANKPNPGGNLILEVSSVHEILNCDDTKKRDGLAAFNYGPWIENFGPFADANTPIFDFHKCWGASNVDNTYNANEKLRITITGEVCLQDVEGNTTRGQQDAQKITAPPAQNGIGTGDVGLTGKKWTLPGMIQGRTPEESSGRLVGEPKTPKTTYTLVYIWSKCGAQSTWSGSIEQNIKIPIAMTVFKPRDEYYASLAPGERAELDKITAALTTGEVSLLGIASTPSYPVLLSLPNAARKLASQLKNANAVQTLVIASLAAKLKDAHLFGALASTKKRLGQKDVVLLSHGGGEAWNVADIIDALNQRNMKSGPRTHP